MAGWFAVSLVVVTAVVGTLVIAFGRRLGRPANGVDGVAVVRVTFGVAVVWAAAGFIGAVIAVLSALFQDDVTITVPVEQFWPRLPEGTEVNGPTASIDGGGFDTATLVARSLSAGTRVMWAISQGLLGLMSGVIALMIAVACWQLLQGKAFRDVVIRAALVTAVVVAVAGTAGQVLGDLAGYQAGVELLQVTSATYPDVPQLPDADMTTWMPMPRFALTIPFWPLASGLGFAALAAVFRYGARLQRDTVGLV